MDGLRTYIVETPYSLMAESGTRQDEIDWRNVDALTPHEAPAIAADLIYRELWPHSLRDLIEFGIAYVREVVQ